MIEIRKPDATLAKLLPPVSPRPDINYIPSQYALPFEHGGKQYVFHNLTKQCIEGVLPKSARAGEKCKACPFLPDCTSFATCPVEDTHCRQVHELMAINALKHMVGKKESENTDGGNPLC